MPALSALRRVGTIAAQQANAVAITGGSIAGISDLAVADGGTGASTQAGAQANLGLGTAATVNTGTSGATIPLLNGVNTWTAAQTFDGVAAVFRLGGVIKGYTAIGTLVDGGSGTDMVVRGEDGISFSIGGSRFARLTNSTFAITPGVTIAGNTVYHAGNLPGTAITWTAAQTFDNSGTSSFVTHDAAGRAFAVRPAGAGSTGIIQFTNHAMSVQWGAIETKSSGFNFVTSGTVLANGRALARVNSGTGANSGLISWGTAAPGSLAEGEIYLRHAA
jgi:hypothetical protein